MASSVFLDTNGWLALLNSVDALHEKADATWRELGEQGCQIVLTDWVVAETGNGLARTPARLQFAEAVSRLVSSPRAELVMITDDLLRAAMEMYGSHADKTWGLIDCASFVVMRERGISEAFTSDRHFGQAGFQCLLPT
jgi:predicted nucleic acid-binding protein